MTIETLRNEEIDEIKVGAINMLRDALIDRYHRNEEIVENIGASMDTSMKRAFINLDLEEINLIADSVVRRIKDEE